MESQTSKWKSDWRSKLKKPKKEQLVVLLLFGVLLVVIAIPTTPGKTTAGGESETISGAEAATGERTKGRAVFSVFIVSLNYSLAK